MRLIPTFGRHSRFRDDVDAFVDGELSGGRLRAFEAHAATCGDCRSAVESARSLKASLQALPPRPTPRSFALTPEMVGSTVKPPARAGQPLPRYVFAVRATAAVAVVAFMAVFVASLAGSSGQSSDTRAGSANDQFAAPESAAGNALSTGAGAQDSNYATVSPTLGLVPATTGAMSGQGVSSATPAPPSTGRETPAAEGVGPSDTASKSAQDNDGAAGGAFHATRENQSEDSGGLPWTIIMGFIAGTSIGALYVVESRRRKS
ncbi:MAG: zf-HC2 domain-containing protein [Dehalococcoidia bacterium]|nr:zf-HC2 domain-containing protein [Dehalococcoidia bacterium]